MGVGGHTLGPRKLRRLSALTGLPLGYAYIRGHDSEGVVWTDTGCEHYRINPHTGDYLRIDNPVHWGTCKPENRP